MLIPGAVNLCALLGLVCAVFSTSVSAIDFAIQASFQPDSSQPNHNRFTNNTPQGGYCASFPTICKGLNIFSLELLMRFDSAAPIEPNHTDPRAGAMFDVPVEWRPLKVVNSRTGEEETVEIRITGVGSFYVLSDTAGNLVGNPSDPNSHGTLWGGSNWSNAPAPCRPTGVSGASPNLFGWFWLTPVAGSCNKKAAFRIPRMYYGSLNIAYELRTPNPLGMSSGEYTGHLTYTVGPRKDFDLGDVMLSRDTAINLSFTLDVQHTLKVEVPPGGNRIELLPQGGWQAWLTQGRKPTRLFRDQTFNISSSSRFKMQLDCQYSQDGNNCAVRDPVSGHTVPMNVSVTLPNGLADASGQPVNRRPLRRDGSGTELFQPVFYVDRKPGSLHFEIAQDQVKDMLMPGVARSYAGSVTVIWDSEVG